jgi:hypothetical protein
MASSLSMIEKLAPEHYIRTYSARLERKLVHIVDGELMRDALDCSGRPDLPAPVFPSAEDFSGSDISAKPSA